MGRATPQVAALQGVRDSPEPRTPSPTEGTDRVSEPQTETPDEPEVETPDETPVETPTPAPSPDEPDEPEPDEPEPDEPEADEPESAPIGAVGERELEAMFKKVDTANANYLKRMEGIMGDEVTVLEPCPRCADPFLGFIFPPMMKPVTADVKDAVLASVGEQPAAASEPDKYARQCDACKGMGVTLSGSRTNRDRTLTCFDCKGRGWVAVGSERASGQVEQPAPSVTNGETPLPEQPPDADPWGRTSGDPDYGRLPQFVGAR